MIVNCGQSSLFYFGTFVMICLGVRVYIIVDVDCTGVGDCVGTGVGAGAGTEIGTT